MANPQVEEGFVPIANEIAEALMRVNLSPYESRVLWFIFRKTYGWSKKTDWLTLSQFAKCIQLDRRLIFRAIKSLAAKNMIVIEKDDSGSIRYGFQKDHEGWITVIKKDDKPVISRDDKEGPQLSSVEMTTVIGRDDTLSSVEMTTVIGRDDTLSSVEMTTVIGRDDTLSSVEMTGLSSVEIPTINTVTKDTSTKDTSTKESDPPPEKEKETPSEKKRKAKKKPEYIFTLPDFIEPETWKAFEEMRKAIKKPMTDWAKALVVTEAVRLSQQNGDDINEIIDQSTRNSWQDVYALKDKAPRGRTQPSFRQAGIAEWLEYKQRSMEE